MGIQGLLPLLKSIHKPCNVKKFSGQTIGVDAYGWLHRGTIACAIDLALDKPTKKFVEFAMHRVRMLQHFGVVPYLVFDGDYLPSKAATECQRSQRRQESKTLGLELLKAGKTPHAFQELQKSIDVSPEMARLLIDELKKCGIEYIVAPYEADAQLVYLERMGIISGILSEDSDMLVFGAKCLLTKLDQYGNCIEINKSDFCSCREVNLTGWSDQEFRQMAILSGCDYLDSISNMGLKTAYRMIRKHKTAENVVRMIRFDGKFRVPKGYVEEFKKAELTFLHQWVYCPLEKALVFHTPPSQPKAEQEMPFIGAYVEPDIAQGIAVGDIHPITKEPIYIARPDVAEVSRSPFVSARPQARRAIASSDFPKGVPLKQFFQPKRLPLAELDPNSFTPSKRQQIALLQNPRSWSGDPIPRPYLPQPNTESTPVVTQPAVTRSSGRTISTMKPIIDPRPAKRTRLCADEAMEAMADMSELIAKVENGYSSRFFNPPSPEPCSRSDESICKALLSLPDYDGWHKLEPKHSKPIAIFDDEAAETRDNDQLALGGAIGGKKEGNAEKASQLAVPSLIRSSSILSLVNEPPTPVAARIPVSARTPAASGVPRFFREKFTFTPQADLAPRDFSNLATPPSGKPSRIPRALHKPLPPFSMANSDVPIMQTPLQRLGAKALNPATTFPATPPSTPVFVSKSSSVKSKLGQSAKPKKSTALLGRTLQVKGYLSAAHVPLPAPTHDEATTLAHDFIDNPKAENINGAVITRAEDKGSEDQIIPDSEEETEDDTMSPPLRPVFSNNLHPSWLSNFNYRG